MKPRPGCPAPRFNCEFVVKTISNVSLCTLDDQVFNRTRIMEVPLLTNSMPLLEGEELILEKSVPKKQTGRDKKRTWRDAQADEQRQSQKTPKNDGFGEKKVEGPSTDGKETDPALFGSLRQGNGSKRPRIAGDDGRSGVTGTEKASKRAAGPG